MQKLKNPRIKQHIISIPPLKLVGYWWYS